MNRLTKLASRGLVPMFNSQKQVFCYALKKVDGKVVFEGISERYTLMCLLGFDRLEKSGHASPIPIAPALESLLTNFAWIDNVGDLGLVLWMCALLAPDRLLRVASELDLKSALTRFAYSSKNVTVHLGWFITRLVLREARIRLVVCRLRRRRARRRTSRLPIIRGRVASLAFIPRNTEELPA